MIIHESNTGVLSVIILTYNQPKYLPRLLSTVLNQTYEKIELIITDDGTKDFDINSLECFIQTNAKGNLINYLILHEDINQGTVKNLNKGLRNASGEYINIIAGDDFYADEGVFNKQVLFLRKNPNLLLVSGEIVDCFEDTEIIADTKDTLRANKEKTKVYAMPKEDRGYYCLRKRIFPYATQSMCFRSSFFKQYGLFDERYVLTEDSPMAQRLIENDIPIGILDSVVVIHRLSSGVSGTRQLFKESGIPYYRDKMLSYSEKLRIEKKVFRRIVYKNYYLIAKYRVNMSESKKKRDRLKNTLQYFPALLLYSIINIDVLFERIPAFFTSLKSN